MALESGLLAEKKSGAEVPPSTVMEEKRPTVALPAALTIGWWVHDVDDAAEAGGDAHAAVVGGEKNDPGRCLDQPEK